jgi:hypothetical protein
MSLWSHVSQIFWEEAEAPTLDPRASAASTGAPAFLREAVRFVVVGASAMVLTAQVAGIRLVAPVSAEPNHCVVKMQTCKDACNAKYSGRAQADCEQKCNAGYQCCLDNDTGCSFGPF